MKKWLVRISAALFCLLFLLVGTVYFLLGTETGTAFVVDLARKQLNGRLVTASVSGIFLDRLELTDCSFSDSFGRVEVGGLVLDWNPVELLHGRLHVKELKAVDISCMLAPGEPEPEKSSEPFSLPDLRLPVALAVDALVLENVVYGAALESKPLVIDHAGLGLSWDEHGIDLRKLQVTLPEGSLRVRGHITPLASYPLQLATELETTDPDLPSLHLVGSLNGDMEKLTLVQELGGDISAELNLVFEQLLQNFSWQGEVTLRKLVPSLFNPDIPGTLQGRITTSGDLHQAGINGVLHLRDDSASAANWDADLDIGLDLDAMQLAVQRLHVSRADLPTELDLSGTASQDMLDLYISWHNLQWPLDREGDYDSAGGSARITGIPDNYHLTLDADFSGVQIPGGTVSLSTDGGLEGVRNLRLKADLLEGTISLQGSAQWAPQVGWQLQTEGKEINPGEFNANWPGNLAWEITSNGELARDGVRAEVMLVKLQGSLRNLPVAGRGKVNLDPEKMIVHDLILSSGRAEVSAHGELGRVSSLDWQVNVPDLGDLLPGAGGRFEGSGTVAGAMEAPQVRLKLSAEDTAFEKIILTRAGINATVDLGEQEAPFSLDLEAEGFALGENRISSLVLDASGSLEKHGIKLTAAHEQGRLALELEGGYQQDARQWQGVFERFDVFTADLGKWQLAEQVGVRGGAESAALDPLCLDGQNGRICLDGTWDAANVDTGGHVEISDFPLQALSRWYPEGVAGLSSIFSLKGSASLKEGLQAALKAEITPGTIEYRTLSSEGSLPLDGITVDLRIADNTLDADVTAGVDANTLALVLHAPDVLKKVNTGSAALTGRLRLDAENFTVVKALMPAVEEFDAQVHTDFAVQGTLTQPQLKGQGKIFLKNFVLPEARIELSGSEVDLKGDGQTLLIAGVLKSPEGSLALDGKAALDMNREYPVRITINGKNFRLVNLPEIRVYLSPDLAFEKTGDLLNLKGSLTVPKAEILLRQLPPGSRSVSPDVVILQEKQEEEEPSPVAMDVRVVLGQDVHFAGMGVNAFVEGQLTVTAEPGEQLMGSGEFHIKEGSYRAYGQDLEIVTGVISFPGGPLTQPGINLQAIRRIGDITVGIYAIGPAAKPRITTLSDPPMPESTILSYLLTGSAPENAGTGARFSIGRQINNKLSVSVGADVKTGDREFVTRYRLNRKIHVQTTTATQGNAADLFYTVEFGGEEGEKKRILNRKGDPGEE